MQIIQVDRFEQEVIGPEPNRFHRFVNAGVAGHDDDRHRQAALLNGPDEIHPVQPGHAQVGKDNAVVAFGQPLQSELGIAGAFDLQVIVRLQQFLQLLAIELLVLDDKKASLDGQVAIVRWRFLGLVRVWPVMTLRFSNSRRRHFVRSSE